VMRGGRGGGLLNLVVPGASKPSKLLLQQAAEVRLVEVVPRLSYG
jgi:hypothetical protein